MPGRGEGPYLFAEVGADAGQLGQILARLHDLRNFFSETPDDARSVAVGAHAERIGLLELEQVRNIVERLRDLGGVRGRSLNVDRLLTASILKDGGSRRFDAGQSKAAPAPGPGQDPPGSFGSTYQQNVAPGLREQVAESGIGGIARVDHQEHGRQLVDAAEEPRSSRGPHFELDLAPGGRTQALG